jgi:hypothetical protein
MQPNLLIEELNRLRYILYLHMQNCLVAQGSYIPSLTVVGKVGTPPPPNPVAYHLHYSVSTSYSLSKTSIAFLGPLVFND